MVVAVVTDLYGDHVPVVEFPQFASAGIVIELIVAWGVTSAQAT